MLTEIRSQDNKQKLADRTTPLLTNYWYVAALSEQVDRTLRDRWILNQSIVLYRTQDGRAVALQNRCGHRSFPLSKSVLTGDSIACGYHGIEYDASGACVSVPCQDTVPSNLAVKAYPVIERAPFVWIWMGEPEAADATLIASELDFFGSSGWSTAVHGYFELKCNYLAMHENLLDLTHFPFLHGEKAGSVDYAKAPFEVESGGDRVTITRKMTAGRLASQRAAQLGIGADDRVDQTSETVFTGPALNVGHSLIVNLDAQPGARSTFNSEIIHALTPAGPSSTHYFWVSARNFSVDDLAMNAAAFARSQETFLEDVVAMEWIETILDREIRPEFHEISVRGDKAGLRMRTIVARLASDQS